jgi:membrane protein YqaA with SNARE-associated domain
MIGLLLLTLGVAVGSAMIPLISVEVFVVAMATAHSADTPPYLAVGAVVAIGQVAGKLVYFFGARGDLRLPARLHRHTKVTAMASAGAPPEAPTRTQAVLHWCKVKLSWLREKCHAHPKWMFATHTVSSVTGLPPFMATTVFAGLSGMSLTAFLISSLPGRFVRFAALAASPGLLMHWSFH